jgi:hypothetical protein
MSAVCYVSERDYQKYFNGHGEVAQPAEPVWAGVERRGSVADRRQHEHDRRWDSSQGRRFRASQDRRKS